jgi:hypothetical protein
MRNASPRGCAGRSRSIWTWALGGLATVLLAAGCEEHGKPADDLGSFFPQSEEALAPHDVVASDSMAIWTQFCKANEGENPYYILMAGWVTELTVDNQAQGVPKEGVVIDFYDYCSVKVASAVSGKEGTFSFIMEIGEDGFDGYAEYTAEGFPLFRQFDKRYDGDMNVTIYRLVSGNLFEAPLVMLGQKPWLGFIQGSVYNHVGGDEVFGAGIESTSGTVTYLSDKLPVPDEELTSTQSRGVFFVYNATPGQVMITISLPDGRKLEKPVITWPLNSYQNRTISTLGVAIDPPVEGMGK